MKSRNIHSCNKDIANNVSRKYHNATAKHKLKGPLSGLGQFLTIENLLKMIKDKFYFILKAPFVLEIFTFLSRLFGYVEKRLDKKAKVTYKIYEVTDWTTNNYNANITQCHKK